MKTKEMMYIALFAAIMGVLGLFPPIMFAFSPVPVTLQTMGVLLVGGILKPKLAALSQMLFLFIVAVGMPILSGGRGGLGVFVGPSAGYLIGYPITAFCISYIFTLFRTLTIKHILFMNLTVGVFFVYVTGIPVQAFLMKLPLLQTIKISLVTIPGDIMKAIFASYLVYKLRKYFIKQDSNKQKSTYESAS
ncbi:biotin transporter BioY [Lederbergia sp. NSJ-179]|uniref:biotin transporter BioY n=1 Tax=Lederbergia sp. NSJ-179 TaxID=2931402 RepID=UPI001FCFB1FE|nr:biotin transporter BioY [Lederbergia sp. NSJ-179]MCJ7841422.1 biotin transporter BioY [Lederbergia sp. NSJ-179]